MSRENGGEEEDNDADDSDIQIIKEISKPKKRISVPTTPIDEDIEEEEEFALLVPSKLNGTTKEERIKRNTNSKESGWYSFLTVTLILALFVFITYIYVYLKYIYQFEIKDLFIWIETAVTGLAVTAVAAIEKPTRNKSPAPTFPLCSRDHLYPITEYLYDTTSYVYRPIETLPTLSSLNVDINSFHTTSTFNHRYPIQIFHNICMNEPGWRSYKMNVITAGGGSNTENEQKWKDKEKEYLSNVNERAQVVWRHWRHGWKYPSAASPDWYYLKGTSLLEDNILRDDQNFGHGLEDHMFPYLMLFLHTKAGIDDRLTHNPYPIENILLHSGCIDEKVFTPTPNKSLAEIDDVWPAYKESSGALRWLFRMILRETRQKVEKQPNEESKGKVPSSFTSAFDYSIPYPDLISPPLNMDVTDRFWGGAHLLFLHDPLTSPSTCEGFIPVTLCYERLVIVGTQEDRNNHMSTEEDNNELIMVFRNITFQTMQVPPPIHIPLEPTPLPNSYHTFPITYLSTLSSSLFTFSNSLAVQPRYSLPRLLVYGREDTDRRRWLNVVFIHSLLKELSGVITTVVTSMKSLSLCEQMVLFSQHDIFVMPHGAAVLATVWAPPKSLIIEIFPVSGIEDTWLSPIKRALDHTVVLLYAETNERRHDPQSHRETGQDDDFVFKGRKIIEVLRQYGVNTTKS